ncbi:MAG TPA: hypothetical protein ACFE0H_05325 [Elainellaceae cyanobacterium]
MFNGIRDIQHPLTRSITAAGITLAAVTMTSGAIVGFLEEKPDSAYKWVGYAALIGAGVGAVAGIATRPSSASRASSQSKRSPRDSHLFTL